MPIHGTGTRPKGKQDFESREEERENPFTERRLIIKSKMTPKDWGFIAFLIGSFALIIWLFIIYPATHGV